MKKTFNHIRKYVVWEQEEDTEGRTDVYSQELTVETIPCIVKSNEFYVVFETSRWAVNDRAEAHEMIDTIFNDLMSERG